MKYLAWRPASLCGRLDEVRRGGVVLEAFRDAAGGQLLRWRAVLLDPLVRQCLEASERHEPMTDVPTPLPTYCKYCDCVIFPSIGRVSVPLHGQRTRRTVRAKNGGQPLRCT